MLKECGSSNKNLINNVSIIDYANFQNKEIKSSYEYTEKILKKLSGIGMAKTQSHPF